MTSFDYDAPAELFSSGAHPKPKAASGHLRFTTAADAIRFAIEVLQDHDLVGATLEVNGQKLDFKALRRLYDSAAYPLFRQPATIQDRLLAARRPS